MKTSQANNKYFEILLDNSIVSKSDLDGNITYVNDNFVEATGFSKEEAVGHNHNILRHPNTANSVFKNLWDTIKNGQVFREKVLSKRKDGSDFWAETIIIPLLEDDNTPVEYIAIRKDITDFLEIKKQIIEQKKINEAKDSFLLLFTHELKTPLNAIINFSKYLLKVGTENIATSKKINLLEQIELSSLKMLEDVTQLLELSKLKSNRLTYNSSIFNICDALNDVIKEHASLAKDNNTSILFYSCERNYYMKSDLYRVKQILSNIVSNAIKYSNSKVHVYTKCHEDRCDIVVDDDGDGIKDKEKIFELFEQDGDRLKEKKGTGIGLSFVKYLCKDLNIKYSVEDSKELGGLSFRLTVKLTRGR